MIQPTVNVTRVSHDRLRSFVYDAARKCDVPEEHAALLSRWLIDSDLRGVLSHGSRQIVRYVREIKAGGINARPNVRVVKETPNSVIVDGDGGLGYFPAHQATLRAIDKAGQQGMAVAISRNHGHIGAAGHYARLTLEHDLLTFVTSGVQLYLRPGDPVQNAAGGSPMSFSAPALTQPPLVLDCGVTHDIQGTPATLDELVRLSPGIVLRAIGFGAICQTWGGLLTGVPIDPARANRKYRSADQGLLLFTFKISLLADVEAFKREMDEYVKRVRQLTPLAGSEGAFLPGGVEAERERNYRQQGIPLSESHRRDLEKLGAELELPLPW